MGGNSGFFFLHPKGSEVPTSPFLTLVEISQAHARWDFSRIVYDRCIKTADVYTVRTHSRCGEGNCIGGRGSYEWTGKKERIKGESFLI